MSVHPEVVAATVVDIGKHGFTTTQFKIPINIRGESVVTGPDRTRTAVIPWFTNPDTFVRLNSPLFGGTID
jgi:hypothetical protein